MAKINAEVAATMNSPSETDFLNCPHGDTSPNSDIKLELFDQSKASDGSVSSTMTIARQPKCKQTTPGKRGDRNENFLQKEDFVTATSHQKQKRKSTKPVKRIDRNERILQQIQRLQRSPKNMIPKRPFHRFVLLAVDLFIYLNRNLLNSFTSYRMIREILMENGAVLYDQNYRITGEALLALQESTEMYMTQFFENCYWATLHRQATTLSLRDIILIRVLFRDK